MAAAMWRRIVRPSMLNSSAPSRYYSKLPRRHRKNTYVLKQKDNPFLRHVNSCYAKRNAEASWSDDLSLHSMEETGHPTLLLLKDFFDSLSHDTIATTQQKMFDSSKKKINELAKNVPQRFGLTVNQLQARYDFLLSCGIESRDAIFISATFSPVLEMKTANSEEVIKFLVSLNVDLTALLGDCPLLLSVDHNTFRENHNLLKEKGFSESDIKRLIGKDPCILTHKVNAEVLSALSGDISAHEVELFSQSLVQHHVQELTGDAFKSNLSLLKEYGIPPKTVAQNGLLLLQLGTGQLQGILDFLMKEPLYLQGPKLKELITKHAGVIAKFAQKDTKSMLLSLQSIVDNNNLLHKIFCKSPFLFEDVKLLEERISLFKKYGFPDAVISRGLLRSVFLFVEDKQLDLLETKLTFLLGEGDVTPYDIMQFPTSLKLPLSALHCRIGFARKVAKDILKLDQLSYKYFSPDKEFAEDFCKSTLENYKAYVCDNNLKLYRVTVL